MSEEPVHFVICVKCRKQFQLGDLYVEVRSFGDPDVTVYWMHMQCPPIDPSVDGRALHVHPVDRHVRIAEAADLDVEVAQLKLLAVLDADDEVDRLLAHPMIDAVVLWALVVMAI